MKVFVNLTNINFEVNLGVWSFAQNLLDALSCKSKIQLVGLCSTEYGLPAKFVHLFNDVRYELQSKNYSEGVELLLHHFQKPLTSLPYVVIFFDLHIWDVPWKYGNTESLISSLKTLVSNAAAVITMFPRTYFDLPRVIKNTPNALFLTISPTLIEFQEYDFQKINKLCEKFFINPDDRVIVYPGQYQLHKNHITLFKAVKQLGMKNFKLICPGSEFKQEHTQRLRNAIKELNLDRTITLAGHLSDEELLILYNRANLIISPSLAEGGAYIAQEAILYKKNAAVSNIRSAILHLKCMNAVIPTFNPIDIDDIVKVIISSLENDQNNELAYNTITNWSWEKLAIHYEEILLWIFNGKKGGEMPFFGPYELGMALSSPNYIENPVKKSKKNKLYNISNYDMVLGLLSEKKINSFEKILSAMKNEKVDLFNAIDGGAGSGSTSKSILANLYSKSRCYAFEPFTGNHRFFPEDETRLILIKKALSNQNGKITFRVPGVVGSDSSWGKRGMVGYSSGGHIVRNKKKGDLEVVCVRADDQVSPDHRIGFIKLDLQGGELEALKGMDRILNECYFMWVEFSGQEGLFSFIKDKGFIIYDTLYLFYGEPSLEASKNFKIHKTGYEMSNGRKAWFGFRNSKWYDYRIQFEIYKNELGLVQTDLVCVNKQFNEQFISIINRNL